ncbi:RNA-processing protein PTA1 [Aspergillus nidulans FGSC A4]|uniref:mRNA cleavage and polyadenylation specificity factor complex subunit (Pta1), putative (AFU_orthologue AFUA_8G04420) n=1 Tax=Emericella nidulans (strain FGSC A4 / ATCC 38163 / CBS 112.46 / NRRL 194 / M139) TaxID=227321 RepID=C8VMC6_EMENI|nr:RNA-processing protein PTA1 [Aspergillus nidulans FGSC A4]CBF84897.1 TPA: mRNA cleavage and polyadenylation specificity factor complex subunit (Pta1), putative (AFU_orthologue; AFUA_8G04420) [Aspergillus nidulans FGSC A4]
MAQSGDQVTDQIAQLNAARNLVLGDAAFYPQIVNGVLPIIGAHARVELRRWGTEFLAETFASPAFATAPKEQLAINVLQTVRSILELPEGDQLVLQNITQTAASLYPLVFRHIINHPEDKQSWEHIEAIKQDLLRRWDSFPCPVKVCCIKFAQRVVLTQTHGPIADPRRPDKNETSLAIVPRNHAILSLPNLEAESSGLLDRILSIFQEDASDPVLVNATLNCLAVVIRTRQSIGNKIINAILNFFPARHMRLPVTPAVRIGVKSMERTARAVFINIMKRNPSHPLAGKMQQHIERLMQSRIEQVDDTSRKRGLPTEPTDGLDAAKRARLDAETPPIIKVPPLPPGRISFAQLFTLTEDSGLSSFDVKQLPADLVVKIAVPLLARVDQSLLGQAVDAIRMRYQTVQKQQMTQPQLAAEEDDDDYEPEYQPMDIPASAADETGAVLAAVQEEQTDLVSLGPFVLPRPPPLTEEQAAEAGRSAVARVFGMLGSTTLTPNPVKGQGQRLGFSRLAGSTFDRDAWVTLLTRLATRAPAGLEGPKQETDSLGRKKPTISDTIRESLYRYILEDFRGRVNIGIMWLNEEWYNDRLQMKVASSNRTDEDEEISVPLHYDHWVLRLLDGFLPYLDSRDNKVFIRFLSEIPEVTIHIAKRIASLAKDPERVNLCVQSFMYLIMFRPPAREICLDALEEVYQNYEESRPSAGKVLSRWRPQRVEQLQAEQTTLVNRTVDNTTITNGSRDPRTAHVAAS